MGSRRSTRDSTVDSLPSGSTELYESADELETVSQSSRAPSLSGALPNDCSFPSAAAASALYFNAVSLHHSHSCLNKALVIHRPSC